MQMSEIFAGPAFDMISATQPQQGGYWLIILVNPGANYRIARWAPSFRKVSRLADKYPLAALAAVYALRVDDGGPHVYSCSD